LYEKTSILLSLGLIAIIGIFRWISTDNNRKTDLAALEKMRVEDKLEMEITFEQT
jgi:hypothetical protein